MGELDSLNGHTADAVPLPRGATRTSHSKPGAKSDPPGLRHGSRRRNGAERGRAGAALGDLPQFESE